MRIGGGSKGCCLDGFITTNLLHSYCTIVFSSEKLRRVGGGDLPHEAFVQNLLGFPGHADDYEDEAIII